MSRLVSINVGAARPLTIGGRSRLTGIYKEPVSGPVELGPLGLAGDVQIDKRYHGGEDKALNVYASEHFAYWAERLGRPVTAGAFGENLTTEGLDETNVAIGDVFRIGAILVQVTQPRQPCSTLAARHSQKQFVRWVEQAGFTGWYVRCLEPGPIAAGDSIERVSRSADPITVAEANRILHAGSDDQEGLRRLIAEPALSTAWREDLSRRIK